MKNQENSNNRRSFLQKSSLFTFGTLRTGGALYEAPHLAPLPVYHQENDINIVGPKEGYTLQIGTLVSMMN